MIQVHTIGNQSILEVIAYTISTIKFNLRPKINIFTKKKI